MSQLIDGKLISAQVLSLIHISAIPKVKQALQKHPGMVPVRFYFQDEQKYYRFSGRAGVRWSAQLERALLQYLPSEQIVLRTIKD